jgi:glycerophosphoryl diester phosphodiesterase
LLIDGRPAGLQPLIDAHRGSCGIPHLPAGERYRRAIALGVDFVEVDIRRSADGEFFSHHDDFTPSGLALRGLTCRALERELGGEFVKVSEVLGLVDGKAGLHVDVKEQGYEADIVRFIEQGCAHCDVVFTSGDASIRAIKEQFPNTRAGLSLGDDQHGGPPWRYLQARWGNLEPRRRLRRSRADFAAVEQGLARSSLLDYCASMKVPAWVWTVNAESEIKAFMSDPRVEVLITDRPDVALRFRSESSPRGQ